MTWQNAKNGIISIFDLWASDQAAPEQMKFMTQLPEEFKNEKIEPVGRVVPWSELQINPSSVQNAVVYFTSEEVC